MTTQIAERLRYEGDDVVARTNPLCDYFAMGGYNPRLALNCTAQAILWVRRGSIGLGGPWRPMARGSLRHLSFKSVR